MSATKRPSAVDGLRRGVATPPAEREPFSEDLKEFSAAMRTQAETTERPPRPPKDVRFTLDLTEDRHAFLKRFAEESGAGVRASQVMRALLDELAEGPNLQARVRARIWAAKR